MGFRDTNGSHNPGQEKRPSINYEKNKRTFCLVDIAVPTDPRVKIKESEKIDNYLNLAREQKTTLEHAGDSGTSCSWRTLSTLHKIGMGIGTVGDPRKNQDHSDYRLIEIEKSPEKTCHSSFGEILPANTDVKNLQRVK